MQGQHFSVGAFAMIFDDRNRVLLALRTDMDYWNLPGGRVERGESPEDGVRREVREEVGLQVVVDRLQGVYIKPTQEDIAFSYWCSVIEGELRHSDEARAIEWFARDDLPKNLRPQHQNRILDAYAHPDSMQYRVYPS
jgi:8-oxo-dGTP diphosphatase